MLILHVIICYSALLWECITDTWPNKLSAPWGQDHIFSTLSPVLNKQLVINRFRFSWAVKDFNATVIAMKNGNFLKPMLVTFLKLSSKEKDSTYFFPLCSIERTHQQSLKEERWGGLVWLLGGFSGPPRALVGFRIPYRVAHILFKGSWHRRNVQNKFWNLISFDSFSRTPVLPSKAWLWQILSRLPGKIAELHGLWSGGSELMALCHSHFPSTTEWARLLKRLSFTLLCVAILQNATRNLRTGVSLCFRSPGKLS